MRRLIFLCAIIACAIASWVWHANLPTVWLGRMLDLPSSMRANNSWVDSSRLFNYTNAFCDIPCTEEEFRNWQASIQGVPVKFGEVPFPTQGMPSKVQEWWISGTIQTPPMFEATKGGGTVVAVWHLGKAFVAFYQRGKLGGSWEKKT